MKKENKAYYSVNPYKVETAKDGKKYVNYGTVIPTLNISEGNEKVGNVLCYNLPVYYTCAHDCECYKNGTCYACKGCYNFASNQAVYSENYAFFRKSTKDLNVENFISALSAEIKQHAKFNLFRYFTCGDIPNHLFLECMVQVAKQFPEIHFWSYTKKYNIVNHYCDTFGRAAIPENLVIVFSHWLNENGSYYAMENPYRFPTSEFIPVGKEELAEKVTYICPCSDPNSLEHCDTCKHPCWKLKDGESMALLEHSTNASKTRDKALREAKNMLKKERN